MKLLNWFPGRSRPRSDIHPWDLSAPLLQLSPHDFWSVGDSVEGLVALGRSGSGKSSGTGRAVATAMLRSGYGGLVLTAKSDEIANWESMCRATGRFDDLMVIRPEGKWRFNPVDHELKRKGEGAGRVESVVGMYSAILDLIDRAGSGGNAREGEAFWRQSTTRMVRMFVGLLVFAVGSVSISDLYQTILSSPRSRDEAQSEAWQNSFCYRLLKLADDRPKTPAEHRDFGLIADFILKELPATPEKTRGSVFAMFAAMSDCLQQGTLYELFGQDSTFTPEASQDGRILLVGLPVKEYGQLGLVANVLMKFAWQSSIERRIATPKTRPVFLYADEAQLFACGTDAMYQATCRSAKAATVYLSQNLSNFYMAMGGGEKGRAEADSLLALLNTRIFHSNGCAITNEWAATQIGKTRQLFMNAGQSSGGASGDNDWFETFTGIGQRSQRNNGVSEQIDFEVQPFAFTTLRTGGVQHNRIIDAITYQSGRRFAATGKTWLPVTFHQAG